LHEVSLAARQLSAIQKAKFPRDRWASSNTVVFYPMINQKKRLAYLYSSPQENMEETDLQDGKSNATSRNSSCSDGREKKQHTLPTAAWNNFVR
jgi:hypothetical protein